MTAAKDKAIISNNSSATPNTQSNSIALEHLNMARTYTNIIAALNFSLEPFCKRLNNQNEKDAQQFDFISEEFTIEDAFVRS